MKEKSLENKYFLHIQDFCKRHNILLNDKIIVAFSGGADSLALLVVLKKMGFSNIFPVYINHNLRKSEELFSEIELNKKNTNTLHLKLEILEISKDDINSLIPQMGIEGAARKLRYELLDNFSKKIGSSFILTAHNSNDCDEEDIIQFFRGGDNFRSIREKNGIIYRPILPFSHKDNENILKYNNLTPSEDSTNFEKENLRSKIRLELVDKIHEVFPSFENSFFQRRMLYSHPSMKENLYSTFRLIGLKNSNSARISTKDLNNIVSFIENGNTKGKFPYCNAVVFHHTSKDKGFTIARNDFSLSEWKSDIFLKNSSLFSLPNGDEGVIIPVSKMDCSAIKKLPSNVLYIAFNDNFSFRSVTDGDFLTQKEKKRDIKDILKSNAISSNLFNFAPILEVDNKMAAIVLYDFGKKNNFDENYINSIDNCKNRALLIFTNNSLFS